MEESINVLGGKLETCSTDPMTGWFRDGCCNTDERDYGRHVDDSDTGAVRRLQRA